MLLSAARGPAFADDGFREINGARMTRQIRVRSREEKLGRAPDRPHHTLTTGCFVQSTLRSAAARSTNAKSRTSLFSLSNDDRSP